MKKTYKRKFKITATIPTIRRNSGWLDTVEARRKFPEIPYKQIAFYPSDHGACLRKLWYAFNGYLKQGRESSRSEDRMDGGSHFERNFIQQLTEAGYPNLSSVRVAVPEWNVSGKADDCFMDEDEGQLYLVEIKATNKRNFESILKTDVANLPNHQYYGRYYRQLQTYLHALRELGVAVQGRILVYCFDDARKESWDVDYDETVIKEIAEYYEKAKAAVAGPEPPPIPDGYQPNAPPCVWCPARSLCW